MHLFNEIEPFAVAWLNNLVGANHLVGRVDPRSITELQPEDVSHAHQAHFFAGIGVWSLALRAAGWPDDLPVWTGSCPCQPFSSAGRGRGTDDERHLWPEWFRLIQQCRPPVIFGEQVASPAGLGWLDAVYADLEGAGYAVAASDLCAAGVGAPHIRQRLYFVAIAGEGGREVVRTARLHGRRQGAGGDQPGPRDGDGARGHDALGRGAPGALADAADPRREGLVRPGHALGPDAHVYPLVLGDPGSARSGRDAGAVSRSQRESASARERAGRFVDVPQSTGAVGGFWRDAEWVLCRDGKARPVEPGTFPLADGATARVGRLRATGNAIVAPLAIEFIEAVMEAV